MRIPALAVGGVPLNIAFATCVRLGKSCIEEILRISGKLDLLITLSDHRAREKSGRIYLYDIAQSENILLLKIDNINESAVLQTLREKEIDWLVIIGWLVADCRTGIAKCAEAGLHRDAPYAPSLGAAVAPRCLGPYLRDLIGQESPC